MAPLEIIDAAGTRIAQRSLELEALLAVDLVPRSRRGTFVVADFNMRICEPQRGDSPFDVVFAISRVPSKRLDIKKVAVAAG